MTAKEVFETWFRRVWTEEDLSAIDEMFPRTRKAEGLGPQVLIGPDEFKNFQQALTKLVSDIEIVIDKSIENDEWTSIMMSGHR